MQSNLRRIRSCSLLKLGCTSFGGPIAHLGYFRAEFVERRKRLTDAAYADLVALCQFPPGPASSRVGVALGLLRGARLALTPRGRVQSEAVADSSRRRREAPTFDRGAGSSTSSTNSRTFRRNCASSASPAFVVR